MLIILYETSKNWIYFDRQQILDLGKFIDEYNHVFMGTIAIQGIIGGENKQILRDGIAGKGSWSWRCSSSREQSAEKSTEMTMTVLNSSSSSSSWRWLYLNHPKNTSKLSRFFIAELRKKDYHMWKGWGHKKRVGSSHCGYIYASSATWAQ